MYFCSAFVFFCSLFLFNSQKISLSESLGYVVDRLSNSEKSKVIFSNLILFILSLSFSCNIPPVNSKYDNLSSLIIFPLLAKIIFSFHI